MKNLGMQGWFSVRYSINIIHRVNLSKEDTHNEVSEDNEKASDIISKPIAPKN